jgi:secondary thiamine-phosphate synthase enzyme
MNVRELKLDTSVSKFVDLTPALRDFCRGAGDGLLSVFAPHATVGLAIMEVGSGSEADLEGALARVLPRDDSVYRHRHGSPGHGADHLLPALLSPSLVIPVSGGEPALGVWQSVVLIDLNPDNPERTVRLSFLAG